jgi:hypothetical protein
MFHTEQLQCSANSGGVTCIDTTTKEATYNTTCDPHLCATATPLVHILQANISFISGREKLRRGADKSLARPGRKQATATTLGIYPTHSPRSSIHFSAHCSNLCKPLKKNSERCPSNQVSAVAMTSASDEKWRTFNCFFQSRERVVVRRARYGE